MQTTGADFPPFSFPCSKANCPRWQPVVRVLSVELTTYSGDDLSFCLRRTSTTHRLMQGVAQFFNELCTGPSGSVYGNRFFVGVDQIQDAADVSECSDDDVSVSSVTVAYDCEAVSTSSSPISLPTILSRAPPERAVVNIFSEANAGVRAAEGANRSHAAGYASPNATAATITQDGFTNSDLAAAIAVPMILTAILLASMLVVGLCWRRAVVLMLFAQNLLLSRHLICIMRLPHRVKNGNDGRVVGARIFYNSASSERQSHTVSDIGNEYAEVLYDTAPYNAAASVQPPAGDEHVYHTLEDCRNSGRSGAIVMTSLALSPPTVYCGYAIPAEQSGGRCTADHYAMLERRSNS